MKTQLLIERLTPNEANMVMEASNAAIKDMWLKGIFMQSELRNRNGRIYPLHELTNAVAQLNEQIKANNGVLGENGHPENLHIDMMNASHVITEVYMSGNDAIGKCKLLNTPAGLVAQEIYKAGIRPAVSSRGAGNVSSDGIVEGFAIVTVDLVSQNSAPGANPDIVYEALQNKTILTLAEQLQADIAAQKYFKAEILSFIKEYFK